MKIYYLHTSIVSEYSLFNGPSDTGCRSTLRSIDSFNNRCLNGMENIVGASVSSFSCRSFGPEEDDEEEEEEKKWKKWKNRNKKENKHRGEKTN